MCLIRRVTNDPLTNGSPADESWRAIVFDSVILILVVQASARE